MERVGKHLLVFGIILFLVLLGGSGQTVQAEGNGWEAEAAKIHTADCNPVESGKLESFFGFESARAKELWDDEGHEVERGGVCKDSHFLLGLTYGLAKNLDLGFSTGWDYFVDDLSPVCVKGLDDLAVGSKWKVFSRGGLGLALLPSLVLPVGTQDNMSHLGTTQKFYSVGLGVVAVQAYRRATVNFDAGYSVPFGGDRGEDRGIFSANAAFGWQSTHYLQPEVELNYSAESEKGWDSAKTLALTAGLLIPAGKYGRIQLGVQPTLWGHLVDRATSYHIAWVMGWP
jgi:hypothetical protein